MVDTAPRSLTLERYVRSIVRAVGVQLALVVILTTAAFSYLRWQVGPDLEAAIDNARTVRTMHEAMLNQETSLRGYLLTGGPSALGPYEEGRGALTEATADAEGAELARGEFASSFTELRLTQQRWIDQWAEPASEGVTFTTEVGRERFIEDGRELFDDYREAQERLIGQLWDERDRLLDHQRLVLAVAGSAALLTGAVLLGFTFRERRRIDALVVEPVDDLRRTMERLSEGDFTARASRTGVRELQHLGASLDAMADQLHDALKVVAEQSGKLTERSERQAHILSMARDIAGSLNVRYVQQTVAEQAHQLAEPAVTTVWLVHDDGERVLVESWRHTSEESREGDAVVELGRDLPGEVARDGRARTADERGTPSVSVDTDRPVAAVGIPMIVGARVVGVIHCRLVPSRRIDMELVTMLETLASHAGTAIEAARLHEATRELSQMDALTKLYNRRRLDNDLDTEFKRSERSGNCLSFVMVDLDQFKSFNDTHGHQRGDEVLQGVAELLAGSVRATDTVYRYGGEELSILLRDTPLDEAAELAERLRAEIARRFSAHDAQREVTASMGVAARVDAITTPGQLVSAADRALYAAKAQGRNRVVVVDGVSSAASTVPSDG